MKTKILDRKHVTEPPKKRGRGRPPKPGRSRTDTRELLIRRGIEMLTEHGFASTGLDALLKQTGVPKGSFYHYFASKDEFGRAVIEGYAAYFNAKLDRWLLDKDDLPLQRLRNFITDAKDGMTRHEFRRGCLIGTLGQELAGSHESFREPLETVFVGWQNRVEACLLAAIEADEIDPGTDCSDLAAYFWIGWEGAILRAKLVRSCAPIDLFAERFFQTLRRA